MKRVKTPEQKKKNAEYMKKTRADAKRKEDIEVVQLALGYGWEDFAFDFAQENCPEMLVTAKVKARK